MILNDDLNRMRKAAKLTVTAAEEGPYGEVSSEEVEHASHVLMLLDELDRIRQLHRQEQTRSADRLKIAVSGMTNGQLHDYVNALQEAELE